MKVNYNLNLRNIRDLQSNSSGILESPKKGNQNPQIEEKRLEARSPRLDNELDKLAEELLMDMDTLT
jgi:hypothetical protein